MTVCVLLVFLSSCSGFKHKLSRHVNRFYFSDATSRVLPRVSMSAINSDPDSAGALIDTDEIDPDFIRLWYVKKFNRRPEIVVADSATTLSDIVVEAWKAILVSVRVMEKDQNLSNFRSLTVFPQLKVGPEDNANLEDVESLVAQVGSIFDSYLLQPNFKRNISCRVIADGPQGPLVMIEVDTGREYAPTPDFDDIDDYTPNVDDALTNDIEEFPFPTVYDFISEINRPPDPITLNDLLFNYRIYDLKYDLNAMAKKKDPEQVVTSINCKLTRLEKWKRVLEKSQSEQVDAFDDTVGWSENVKLKYQSLKAIVGKDTKNALDTQYDKRSTFIEIINRWSDRLKRNFKFTYFQSNRAPENFEQIILESSWRKDVQETISLLAQAPFLDFEGPKFTPGTVTPLFKDDRVLLWDSNYDVEIASFEMLSWLNKIEKVRAYAGIPPLGDIVQHTYSRGLITERVMTDVYSGLTHWVRNEVNGGTPSLAQPPIDIKGIFDDVGGNGSDALDHHDRFKCSVERINSMAREKSSQKLQSVKEVFKASYYQGREMVDWWTDIVRNLDKTHEMDKIIGGKWADVITNTIEEGESSGDLQEELKFQRLGSGAALPADGEENPEMKNWVEKYREPMLMAEEIKGCIEWGQPDDDKVELQDRVTEAFRMSGWFKGDCPSVPFAHAEHDNASKSYLFIAPRYFRGIGMDEELSAFNEFSQAVTKLVTSSPFQKSLNLDGFKLEIIPLHPLAVSERGTADYGRRAPHPALLFKLDKL